MNRFSWSSAFIIAIALAQTSGAPSLAASAATQDTARAASVTLTPDAMRVFLAEAEIVRSRAAGKGVTETRVATLSDGRVTHDAQIQTVDIARDVFEAGAKSEFNFKDSYKFNIAGYELARLIGLDNVPMSVERRVQGKLAAMTWWLDDLLVVDGEVVDEEVRVKKNVRPPNSLRFSRQVQIMHVFDELIQNVDRNQGNALWDETWKLWMVDHTRAFRLGKDLKKPEALISCERALLDGLRRLTADALTKAVGRNLTRFEVEAVMARRDLIVQHYEARIAQYGESAVLFTLDAMPAVTR